MPPDLGFEQVTNIRLLSLHNIFNMCVCVCVCVCIYIYIYNIYYINTFLYMTGYIEKLINKSPYGNLFQNIIKCKRVSFILDTGLP